MRHAASPLPPDRLTNLPNWCDSRGDHVKNYRAGQHGRHADVYDGTPVAMALVMVGCGGLALLCFIAAQLLTEPRQQMTCN